MIRPLTCICMLLAASSGLYLYQTKHRTRMLDRTIEHTLAATEAVHERTRLLSAEWALLNDPSRLGDLANRFLTLHPVAPGQFTTLAELDKRLPAVRAYPPAGANPPEPQPEVPMALTAPKALAPSPPAAEPVAKAQPPAAPVAPPSHPMLAAAVPAPHPAGRTVVADRPLGEHAAGEHLGAEHLGAERHEPMVAALPMPRAGSTPPGTQARPMATPVSNPMMLNPVLSRVMATTGHQGRRDADYSNVAEVGSGQSVARVYPGAASELGSARTALPPPVPVAASGYAPIASTR